MADPNCALSGLCLLMRFLRHIQNRMRRPSLITPNLKAQALAVLTALTGIAAPAPAEQEAVTIRVAHLPRPDQIQVPAIAKRAVIQAFQRRHPEILIERFYMPEALGAGSAQDTGPLMAIAAGIPPHAIYVNFRLSATYIGEGFLVPLEQLVARLLSDDHRLRQTDGQGHWRAQPNNEQLQAAVETIQARIPSPVWEVVYREDHTGRIPGKHVWALPTRTLVKALLYRKDLFSASGLDPERPPKNWDEFLSYAQQMTDPKRQTVGLMMSGGIYMSWSVYDLLVSTGARAVAWTDDGLLRAAYDSREAAEAVYFFWRLAREPFERNGQMIRGAAKIGGDTSIMWKRGQIGMYIASLSDELMAAINPQLVGIAPVPLSHRGIRGSNLNSEALGVFSGSSPRQQLAAMQYIWFLTGEEAQRLRTKIYVDYGFGPFVRPDLLRKFGYERMLRRVPKGWQDVFDRAMAGGVPEPYGPNTQNIYRYMTYPMYEALETDFSNVSADQAIEQIQKLLQASVREANTKLMKIIPPEQMSKQRRTATIVLVGMLGLFLLGGITIWRSFARSAPISTEGGSRRRFVWAWILLAPALLLTIGWIYLPLGGGLALAFTDYRLAIENTFVGVDHFATAIYESDFWQGLGRSFYFVALMIVLGFWPPILLALLLDEVPTVPLKYAFRTLFYLPAIISGVIIIFLWKQLYDSSPNGVLNRLLLSLNSLGPVSASGVKLVAIALFGSLIGLLLWLPIQMQEMSRLMRATLWFLAGIFLATITGAMVQGAFAPSDLVGQFHLEPLRWIDSPQMAMFCVVLPTVWAGAGPGCLLYLAALKTIPDQLYEAADIDGAGFWHKVCYITLPRLKYLITIQFVAAVIGAFKGGTDYILVMTGGGPNNASMVLALEIFTRTFMELGFGIGSAMAWMLGAMLIGFAAYQLKLLARAEFAAEGTEQPPS